MRQIKRNVSAFAVCLGVVVGTFFAAPAASAAEGPAAPVSANVSADVVAGLSLNALGLLDLSLFVEASVNAGVTL